ncbi:DivIVA domain-containing protein [Bacteroidota bacterium]
MKFTPYNIKNQEFNKAVRGYDREEVRAFLESLSDEFERLTNDNEELHKDVDLFKEEIKEFKKLEKTLQSTLVNAQESTSKALDSAKKQNALILKEAEIKAAQIIEKAKSEAELIRNSVLELREEKNLLLAKLKAIINTQINILDLTSETKTDKKENEVTEELKLEEENDLDVNDIMEKLI